MSTTTRSGYHSRLLRVDLTERTVRVEALAGKLLDDFMGGRGLGTKLLFDEVAPGTDPLGPDNRLYVVTAPLNGTAAPAAGRFDIVTRSPATGTVTAAQSGGRFGLALKAAGFDVLAIQGAADAPCYLLLEDEGARICDAADLWGHDTARTTDTLRSRHGANVGVACIGPAGERCIGAATVINDRHLAATRGGTGAVMGAKRLKAIVAQGTRKAPIGNDAAVAAASGRAQTFLGGAPLTGGTLREFGTPHFLKMINALGGLPAHNFQAGTFADADSLAAECIQERYVCGFEPCGGCPIPGVRLTATATRAGAGPEYEAVAAFGALCGVNDLEAVIHANYTCIELGLDAASAGNVIACAMELSERGYLDEATCRQVRADLGGRDLRFGDGAAIMRLTELMGRGAGFGQLLALGSARLAAQFGHPETAMQVKGLELPAVDPRAFHGVSLALATSHRGALLIGPEALGAPFAIDRFATHGKAGLVTLYQDLTAAVDAMGLCGYTMLTLNPDLFAESAAAVTDRPIDGPELLRIGERIGNLERLFNWREGFDRKDDTLPARLRETPLTAGHSKGRLPALDALLDDYYAVRGWTADGVPTPERLAALGLTAEGRAAGLVPPEATA